MIFQVINSSGQCVMNTEEVECIPFNNLDNMSASGYKFKMDGKLISKNQIRSSFSLEDKSRNSAHTNINSSSHSKKVRCIDNGKIYDNQSAAAKDLGIDPAQVSDSIKTGRPRSGYRFERVS